jgi:serine O-acetyltransferase
MQTLELIKSDLNRVSGYYGSNKLNKIFLGCYYFLVQGGVRSLVMYRIYRPLFLKQSILFSLVYAVSSFITPIEISGGVQIGKSAYIPHPQCIIIGYGTIGDNCTISQGVTIGLKKELDEFPEIGDNVHIGAGAKVLGSVKIGDNSRVGANAVVIDLNVPENSIAVGIPAKIKEKGKHVYKPMNMYIGH